MKLRRVIILAFGGVLVLGAACGGGGSTDADSGGSADDGAVTTAAAAAASSDAGDGCQTASKADVESVFGAGFSDLEDTSTGGTVICNFERESDITSVQYTIKPSSAGEYEATIEASKDAGSTATPLSGIGDKATLLRMDKYGVTVLQVMAVKDNALFYVMATSQAGPVQDKAEAFAKLIAERL